jgi:hypothetical protein
MDTLLAWLWAPAVLWGTCLGLGLLAERICRFRLPGALVAPVGLGAFVALVMPGYRLGAGAGPAVTVVLVLAAAGFVLARRDLRSRLRPGWGALAALAAYVLYLAPVALSGHRTFAGYDFVNDTSLNFVWADMLEHGGYQVTALAPSTTATVQAAALNSGYPLGAFALVATVRPLSFAPLEAIYQPLISVAAALAACALCTTARRLRLPAPAAVAAALLAVGSNLIYVYAQQGAIKELFTVALLVTAAAVALEAKAVGVTVGAAALVALAAAPMVFVFSGGAGALVAGLGVGWAVSILLERGRLFARRRVGATLLGTGLAAVAAIPFLVIALRFVRGTGHSFTTAADVSTAQLGQLLRPLPVTQAAGIWLAADYRRAVPAGLAPLNALGIAVVLVLAAVALVLELRNRRIETALALVAVALVYLVAAPRLTPYADAKLLLLTSAPLVFAAAVAAWRVAVWRAWLGLPLAAVMALGVLYSDARAYHAVRLAPAGRLEALADAGDHAHALRPRGLWMVNEWEEYAKYFMRRVRNNMAAESFSPSPVVLRKPQPIFGQYFDLDAQRLSYVSQFPGIVTRRSPAASRPPASFRLVYQNAYYLVWVRDPQPRVLEHLPLQGPSAVAAVPRCADVRALARRARGQALVAAVPPVAIGFDPRAGRLPPNWIRQSNGLESPHTPGAVSAVRRTPAGRYDVWVRGSTGRSIGVLVDGRLVRAVKTVNGPGQWMYAGAVTLGAGMHRLALRRPSGSLAPGDGYDGELGPLELVPQRPERLERVAPARAAAQLCGRPLDWIERVAGA